MAGPSGKKDGLRCECGRLLIEKDPVAGFGVRCDRRECDKFHPLEEINQRTAELQKENPKEEKMGEHKEETIPREEVRTKLNELLLKAEFFPEDIPNLVELLYSRAMPKINKMLDHCHCGACNEGIFMPVLSGYVHPEGQMFNKSNLRHVTIGICDHCGYIHEFRD